MTEQLHNWLPALVREALEGGDKTFDDLIAYARTRGRVVSRSALTREMQRTGRRPVRIEGRRVWWGNNGGEG